MKKVLFVCILFLAFTLNVKAREYGLYQLIPVNSDATVETENFVYSNFYYNDNEMQANALKSNHIIFSSIKNISKEERPISISIGVFDKDKKNIGIVNYCSSNEKYSLLPTSIKSGEEMAYSVGVMSKHIVDGRNITEVKYISVLGDNVDCKMAGTSEGEGMTVEEMKENEGQVKIGKNTMYFMYAAGGVVGLVVLVFILKFIFTGGKSREDVIREQYRKHYTNNNLNTNINSNPQSNINPQNNNSQINQTNTSTSSNTEEVKDFNPKNNNPKDDQGSNLFDMYK